MSKGRLFRVKRFCSVSLRLIDDVLSLNNPDFEYPSILYPATFEIEHTTDTSASYMYLVLEFDILGKLKTLLNNKRDEFDFNIVNIFLMSNNIPQSPAYSV